MSWMVILGLMLAAILVLATFRKSGGGAGTIGYPYQPARLLFSAAERSFLGALDQAVGLEHRVFGKVRVADVAAVKPGLSASARQGALNRIASKHFDFVVCRASDLAVLCAIELNDRSHSSQRAQSRDDLLVNVCKAIDLPLLQIPAKLAYSPQELRSQFQAAIGSPQIIVVVGT